MSKEHLLFIHSFTLLFIQQIFVLTNTWMEMATHSDILAWRIPWTDEPGGLQSMGFQKSGTTKPLSGVVQYWANQTKNCSLNLFSRVLTNRQPLLGRFPLYGHWCSWFYFLFPLGNSLYPHNKPMPFTYRLTSFICVYCHPPPNSHPLPCILLQEDLEKNVNGHIFISR